mmetsp:Transcript_1568/g.2765  ORF Transcript_1568/g.2765 Transcript_1568/m.2765 type:complete len:90 (+) Transcript_1568:399-668(+)
MQREREMEEQKKMDDMLKQYENANQEQVAPSNQPNFSKLEQLEKEKQEIDAYLLWKQKQELLEAQAAQAAQQPPAHSVSNENVMPNQQT